MYRRERVSEVLLAFLAEQLQQMRDPRLEHVTLTEVSLARDCKSAHVYWSSLGHPGLGHSGPAAGEPAKVVSTPTAQEVEEINSALKGTVPLLRRRIGDELDMRSVPSLLFRYDESAVRGARIDELLKKVGL